MAAITGFEDIGSDELFDLVWRDDLTGLYNRRFFARYMKQVADWGPGAPPVSVAMMDMDNLKRINDRLGHMQGDAALKRIGEIMNEQAGDAYYAVRYAGDEFCMVFPGCPRDQAIQFCESLREAVVRDSYTEANLPEGLRPSLSVGVAMFPDDAPAGGDDLTEKADEALYHSKRTGKNKVTSAADLKKGGGETTSDIRAMAGFPSATLLGRAEQLKEAEEALSVAIDGKNAMLLLEGEPGMGKTRLLSEFGKYAKERGLGVLIERCSAATRDESYKTICGLLETYLRGNASVLAELASQLEIHQRVALSNVMQIFKETVPRRPRRSGAARRPTPGPGQRRGTGRPGSKSGRRPPPQNKGRRPSGESGRRPPPEGRRPPPPGEGRRPPRRRPPEGRSAPPSRKHPRQRPGPPSGQHSRPPGPPSGQHSRQGPPSGKQQRPPPQRGGGSSRPIRRRVKPRPAPVPELNPAELTAALFSGLIAMLKVLSKKKGLVIILDDIESADEATLEVISRCLLLEGRVLFVGAARTTAGQRDGEDDDAPYKTFRERLGDFPSARVVTVTALDEEDTGLLAGNLLEGFKPKPEFVTSLHGLTQGNPLFVEGLLRHLVDVGHMEQLGDNWVIGQELPAEMPLTLENLIRQQLKILGPDLAAFLHRAAVIGPNFEFNVLQTSLEETADEDDALEFVEEAERAGVLVKQEGEDGETKVEFASRKVQEVAYEDMEPAERQEAHRKVAEGLTGDREAERAYHFGKAGDLEKQERFLRSVREKQDLVFDREAVETLLLDSHRGTVPEQTDDPPPELFAALPILAKNIATAAKVIRLYPSTAKVVREAVSALVKTLKKAHHIAPSFTISHRGNAFTVNGQTVDKAYATGQYQEAVIGIFRANSIKSLTFRAPPAAKELKAFLGEAAKHTVQVQLEKYFWAVFAKQRELKSVGINQKILSISKRRSETETWSRLKNARQRIGERNLPLVTRLLQHFMASLEGLRDPSIPDREEVTAEALACFNRSLRRIYEKVPAVAFHEGEGESLVVNGTTLPVKTTGRAPTGMLKLLRSTGLHGMVILREATPQELRRFMEAIAELPEQGALNGDPKQNPVAKIVADGSFPNILVGDAMFQLAHDLVRRAKSIESMAPAEDLGHLTSSTYITALQKFLDEYLPLHEREKDLPAGFEWPSDTLAKSARTLFNRPPHDLLEDEESQEFLDVVEALLMEDRGEVAQRLILRMAVNFASEIADHRKRSGKLFLRLASHGSQELRARFFTQTAVRLGDALELETDFDVFEVLAECAKAGILDRIASGDWDLAARLVWSLNRRREARVEAQQRLKEVSQRVLRDVLHDPRTGRLFETIETGSQQERRRAARILEGMGKAAVDSLVRALMNTQRSRVETFLIDMLAALAPESDRAIQKEVTPNSPPDSSRRLLRAAAVVCQDPTPVLVSGLQNLDPQVQGEAVGVARSIGHNVAQNVLRWALTDGSAAVQLESVKHLGELARPDTVDQLVELLQSTNMVEVRRECCLALGKLALNRGHQDKVVPVLSSFLRAGSLLRTEYHEDVRAAAAWALGQMTTVEAARKALERALDDKNKRVRLTARLTLEGRQV